MSEEKKLNIPWFKRGDVDAVIGVFFDGFSKIIVGIGVLTGVMGMSQDIVFGKIVSAIGLSAFRCISELYRLQHIRYFQDYSLTGLTDISDM